MESKDLKIKVIGIGGAGNNIVNSMNENKLDGVELYVANTTFPKFITINGIDRMLAQALTDSLICYGAASYEGYRFSRAIS